MVDPLPSAADGVRWRDAATVLAHALRDHGQDPAAVRDVAAAWAAFGAFVQVPVTGLDPDEDGDIDGLIVEWGRWSPYDRRPALHLVRQLAGMVGDEVTLWQVGLVLVFDESDTTAACPDESAPFDFAPPGPARAATLARLDGFGPLRVVRGSTPRTSTITVDEAE